VRRLRNRPHPVSFIPPQLLTAARVAPEGERWLHEVKFDGYRLGAHVDGGRVRLYTRGGHDWTKHLRPVEAAVAELGLRGAYLDGEVVAVAPDGLPDFDALHRAMRGGRNAPALVYHVFDVLRARGRELFFVDIAERKRMLAELIGSGGEAIRYVDHLVGRGPELFAHAFSLGIEGIVSKRVGSGYRPGERSSRWLKVKCYHVYPMTVARVKDGEVAVVDVEGAHAGWVPVYSRLQLAALRPGDAVTVKALAWRAGRTLRHATLLAEDAEPVTAP
jgi:bifunctional non-homologous end joining protein LigD